MSGRRQLVLRGEDPDEIDAALPALEAALVDARLDVVLAEAAVVDAVFAGQDVVVLGHELDPDVPELAAGEGQGRRAVVGGGGGAAVIAIAAAGGHVVGEVDGEGVVGDLGGELGEEGGERVDGCWELGLAGDGEGAV